MIAMMKEDKRQVIFTKTSTQLIQANTSTKKECYDSSTRRLLIAYLPEKELLLYIKKYGLPNKNTWSKATSRIVFFNEIPKIKTQGHALIEDSVQVTGVATPIYQTDNVIASYSIYLPSFRFDHKKEVNKIKEAVEIGQMLSIQN